MDRQHEAVDRRVLIVDDDANIRDGLVKLINSAGYSAIGVPDVHLAYRELEDKPFDVMITDILMPLENGLSLIQEARWADGDLKIIALSGGGNTAGIALLEVAKRLGAHRAIRKPASNDQILKAISDLTSQDQQFAASNSITQREEG